LQLGLHLSGALIGLRQLLDQFSQFSKLVVPPQPLPLGMQAIQIALPLHALLFRPKQLMLQSTMAPDPGAKRLVRKVSPRTLWQALLGESVQSELLQQPATRVYHLGFAFASGDCLVPIVYFDQMLKKASNHIHGKT